MAHYYWPDPDATLPEGLGTSGPTPPLSGPVVRLIPRPRRNLDTPESREWWASVERIAATVRTWPESRRYYQ